MATITIHPEFGYVIFTLIASWVMLMYLGINVGKARKKYEVKYPTMYSDRSPIFNCIQRGHQNTLEQYPIYAIFQIISGLQFPVCSSVAGLVWIVSRISYAHGYSTGDPEKRLRGAYGYFGLFAMVGMSIYLALSLLQWV
ncbi:glutathione S-transferase 3, mitochondrial-like [Ptychodera flava]|uniref:glutathione S-transferase 3, mitochondrial-like n=1 Tax=Ptychodera flava TaxID=63121 RepID=UPI003969F303